MKEHSRPTRGRPTRNLFVALYLVVQIAVPIVGLILAHRTEAPIRFSWHMFSRVPEVVDE